MEGRDVLKGDQYPKGLTEEEVRKIAREESVNAFAVLKDAIANTPQRADGNINARDFHDTLDIVGKQLMSEGNESDDSEQGS
jgi:hypothetical protein